MASDSSMAVSQLTPQNNDPSLRRVHCAIAACDKEVTIGDSFSFILTLATTGPDHVRGGWNCPEEQHFACSWMHARQAAIACIDEHAALYHQAAIQERGGRTDDVRTDA